MNLKDSAESLKDFWDEFRKERSGLVGLALLLVFVLLGIFGPFLVPFPGATEHWRDIDFWKDNSQAAPPAWTNLFASKKGAPSTYIAGGGYKEEDQDTGIKLASYRMSYDYTADLPPMDMIIRLAGSGQVPTIVTVKRPCPVEFHEADRESN